MEATEDTDVPEEINVETDETENSEISTNDESMIIEESGSKTPDQENSLPEKKRLVKLPLARVKHIMKMDADCSVISSDAVFLVTKATELFLEYLGQQSVKYTLGTKRKTMFKRDVEAAIDAIPNLCFLEGTLE